ncbi:DUF6588 family protein [Flexithrix dorotheae]|uniref:DUF6588 family protein n=1 Tax=Flexithrix dorotheae TaxID=70993 RepID=UPI0003695237|nr:DUF6588 family protein [Flexithrix dorotheae]
MIKNKIIYLLLFFTFSLQWGFSQNLEDFVSKYSGKNGTGYMQPLSDAFGANMNSGLFRDAKVKKSGFQMYLGLVTTTALISNNSKTFSAETEDGFTPSQTVTAPTIFGSTNVVVAKGDEGTETYFPGGLGMDIMPVAFPQLSIGSILGTEATVRFYAFDVSEDLGKLNMLGLGARHSISQYLTETFPIDLAVGYYWNSFSVGNIVDAKSNFISLQGSYETGVLTVYSGLGLGSSKMDLEYTTDQTGEEETISLALETKNKPKFTLGLGLNLGVFRLNADYNLGVENVFSAGLGFAFGADQE